MDESSVQIGIDAALAQAVASHHAQRWQEAEALYKAILKTAPDHPDANHNLGLLALQFGHAKIAIDRIRRALRVRGDVTQYWLSYSAALIAAGSSAEARRIATQGLLECYAAGQYQVVETLARHMTGLWPDDGFSWKALGTALCLQDKYQDALSALNEAARLMPNNPEAFNSLGNAYNSLGMQPEALNCYRRAVSLAPNYKEALNSLASVLMDAGQVEECFGILGRVSRLAVDTAAGHTAPEAADVDSAQIDKAYAACRLALQTAPQDTHPTRTRVWRAGMNRYLICKGWEGFCDRLQCLSHTISLALRYRRILYVDWNDRIWSHGSGGFYRYFDLVDLPYVTAAEQMQPNLRVIPAFWAQGMKLPADDWVYRFKGKLIFDDKLNFDPMRTDFKGSAWVHSGVGFRAFNLPKLVRHLRLSAEAAVAIAPLLEAIPVDLPVVHLRGTDRPVDQERWQVLRKAAPVACVVSDDVRLVQRWLEESPDSILLSDTLVTCQSGGHKLGPDEIAQHGFDKFRMNIRLLADFITLAAAKEAHALNEKSLFFKMARRFGGCGGVSSLLQRAPDPTILPTDKSGYSCQIRTPKH